jgi:hypothetical protein
MTDGPEKENARTSASISPLGDGEPFQERLLWLFRDALRQQRVHPLMDILRLYREASTQ